MAQKQSFGKRGQSGNRPAANPAGRPKPFHQAIEEYKDPAAASFVANRPWPAAAAAGITLTLTGGLFLTGAGKGVLSLAVIPVMLLVGYLMYLQFRGLQAQMQDDEERIKRAISAKYPLVPVLGMIAGLVYFMVSEQQDFSDIAAYDWSGIFGLRTDIEADEPLSATLLETMATFGGAGLVAAYLWYKAGQYFSDRS
ncbi:hypothetical protein [Roseibium sediminicola]|uniref:Uncharacterized protein n=1 Tax=Roseibium sediminicola TaxID=2933272 RepID=A0ABT0GP76_9HYPH|nr:hypothetical protein [Roseibium sp. CAU 1639]MCK7610675.1 hypothetical protein [Roseibium sp. CAU 1639]